jgi:exonuclease SbcC
VRILAVRGKDLASLAGEFAVEFDRPPLRGTGLFAVCGPVGAGKSTLLDAMCLALFDRTPRLGGRTGTTFGAEDLDEKDRVSSQDVRNVLRRGAGDGYAEVDFVGKDGEVYRARWEVRRARGRASGRFQNQQMSLHRVRDGQDLTGAKRTETKALIVDRLGLEFDAFRRSVLLAQGEFAEFLRAKGADRADLLERVTRTESYARISRLAFADAREHKQRIASLEQRLGGIEPLTQEARADLDRGFADAKQHVERLAGLERRIERSLQWHENRARLAAELAAAESEREQAVARLEAAKPRREAFARLENARKLQAPFERLEQANERAETSAEELATAVKELDAALARAVAAGKAVAVADARRERIEQAWQALAPRLAEARSAEGEAAQARTRVRDARDEFDERRSRVGLLRDAERTALGRAERERARLAELRERAASTAAWDAATERFAGIEARAEALRRAGEDLAAAITNRENAERRVGVARVRARRADAVRAALAEGDLGGEARAELDRLATRRTQLAAAADGLRARRVRAGAISKCVEAIERAAAARVRLTDAKGSLATIDATAAGLRTAVAEAETERDRCRTRLEEAERSLASARAVMDLADHRAALREGEPCPLCGALEHPYGTGDAPGSRIVHDQERRVAELRKDVERLAGDVTRLATERRSAEQQGAEIRRSLAAIEADWSESLAKARSGVAAAFASDGSATPDVDADGLVALEDARASMERAAGEVAAAEAAAEELRALDETVTLLERRLLRVTRRIERADDRARTARKQTAERTRELDAARGTVRAAQTRWRDARRELATEVVAVPALARSLQERLGAVVEGEDGLGSPRRDASAADDETAVHAPASDEVGGAASSEGSDGVGDPRGDTAGGAIDARELGAWLAGFLESARRGVAERRSLLAEASSAERAHAAATADVATAGRERAASCDEQRKAFARLRAAAAILREAEAATRRFFGGRGVDEVDSVRAEMLRRVRAEAAAAESECAEAKTARDAAARAERGARSRHDGNEKERTEARLSLSALLRDHELTLDELRTALAREDADVDAERAALAALTRAVDQATTLCGERRRALAQHASDDPPVWSPRESERALAHVRAAKQQVEDERAELQQQQLADDRLRKEGAALGRELEAARHAAAIPLQLDEMIGSADGKKFRTFAQGLTFEALLRAANQHLATLAPRYRLQRVPGSDLDLQVRDLDMGDEIRAVESLSGGETFLTSLALALALSSLSAHEATVESLFIDEGFGTLDAETFDMALSVLEALHGEGRQVGIISHVDGIAERIGTRIQVVKEGAGRSRVVVLDGVGAEVG